MAKVTEPAGPVHPATLRAPTLHAIQRSSGEFAAASVTAMEQHLPWFRRMPADQRASVLLIVQAGVAGFVEWCANPQAALRLSAETFRAAPRELSRWISLRQAVELIRHALEVFEERIPELAEHGERAALTEAVLRYGREIAFSAATSYAAAAEARGAWDARLEALVVDGVVRGDAEESLLSRAAALGWDPAAEATVLLGNPASQDQPTALHQVRSRAARLGRPVLLGLQGARLVVILGGPVHEQPGAEPGELTTLAGAFGDGPVVAGPTAPSLGEAHRSAAEALSGMRAVIGWPTAPRPVRATDLLPERALAGDAEAERQLVEGLARPLEEAGGALLDTVQAYLDCGGVLETCARRLYVHANTVRYRLRRVAELTGHSPLDPRDALVLRTALTVGRLARARGTE